ncbi:MAG: hypothetical protein JW971_10640 [Synergistales bacterium]|nr:hypothetical protein [Synergistales bacterium]
MKINNDLLKEYYETLDARSRSSLDEAISKMVEVKERGGKIMVATGSGPNIHEGVTTLIAELMDKGIIDSVTTSSAVIGHEMAGALDRVKMVGASQLGLDEKYMPRGNVFEFTQMGQEELDSLRKEMVLDEELLRKAEDITGNIIIKAAGNMAYPMGTRTEELAGEILSIAKMYGLPFEEVAGWGADERTMIGIGAKKGLPVLVSIPQMIGGGHVGLSIGDSISVSQRSMRIARMLEEADVIIESAVALTQEIHDGPFECYTGHGMWSWWKGVHTYSLKNKSLIRIDLDENLRKAQDIQKESSMIQEAINKGLPKTKISRIPFRMEMSAFARHEGSIPIIGDIGRVWPLLAWKVAEKLGIELDFMSYNQESGEGRKMREWIVSQVRPIDRDALHDKAREYRLQVFRS